MIQSTLKTNLKMYLQNLNRSPSVFKRLNSFILGPRSSSNTRSSHAFFTWSDIVNLNAVNPLLSIYQGKIIISSTALPRRDPPVELMKVIQVISLRVDCHLELWLVKYYSTISVVQSYGSLHSHTFQPHASVCGESSLVSTLWRQVFLFGSTEMFLSGQRIVKAKFSMTFFYFPYHSCMRKCAV